MLERRALYNLVRMNWLNDPGLPVEPWQVKDYRSLSTLTIFENLRKKGVDLDEDRFVAYTDSEESPEELADFLIERENLEPEEQDQIYLLIFELWRRLVPEKLCITIFCDEFDHQIYLYDKRDPSAGESIQDVVANLQMILEENLDDGAQPTEIFSSIGAACANNLEGFLYDFIAEQIDSNNIPYAFELYEGFKIYFKGNKWFDLLRVRLSEESDPDLANEKLKKLVLKASKEQDLQFNFEIFEFLVQGGEKGDFNRMVRKTVPLLETEEELQDLLTICTDYYRCLDEDQKELAVQSILDQRAPNSLDDSIDQNDASLPELLKILR